MFAHTKHQPSSIVNLGNKAQRSHSFFLLSPPPDLECSTCSFSKLKKKFENLKKGKKREKERQKKLSLPKLWGCYCHHLPKRQRPPTSSRPIAIVSWPKSRSTWQQSSHVLLITITRGGQTNFRPKLKPTTSTWPAKEGQIRTEPRICESSHQPDNHIDSVLHHANIGFPGNNVTSPSLFFII